ncbi:MAG: DUF1294 domain-containing protein [Ruminococcaceae bacterium]|nr:DUF1294 domain-containing protein [Oscillospiraceae bacterium]
MEILILWNTIVCLLYGYDKYKSIRNKRRISEKTLIGSAFLLGGVGALCGMFLFRHKIRKIKFCILVPVFSAVDLLILYFCK